MISFSFSRGTTKRVNIMNTTVRRFIRGNPISRFLYERARTAYHGHRLKNAARQLFVNPAEYGNAFVAEDGKFTDLRMKDGLVFSVRRNHADAAVLGETFIDNCYIRGLS